MGMFGEPMDSILAAVGGVWLLGSVSAVPVLWWRNIVNGRPAGFRKAVDTGAVWVNRITVGVVWVLLAIYYIEVAYDRWGTRALVAGCVWLGVVLLAPLGAKLSHTQGRDTDDADRLDADPEVGELAGSVHRGEPADRADLDYRAAKRAASPKMET